MSSGLLLIDVKRFEQSHPFRRGGRRHLSPGERFFFPSPESSTTVCFNARMALGAAGRLLLTAAAAAAVDGLPASQLGALHPCGPSGMVRSRRTCHCHSGGDGSRSVSAEGWREAEGGRQRRKASSTACHCSAAAAEPHREHLPSPFPRHNLFTKTPRGPVRGFFYER